MARFALELSPRWIISKWLSRQTLVLATAKNVISREDVREGDILFADPRKGGNGEFMLVLESERTLPREYTAQVRRNLFRKWDQQAKRWRDKKGRFCREHSELALGMVLLLVGTAKREPIIGKGGDNS